MWRKALNFARDLTLYVDVVSTRRALKAEGGEVDFNSARFRQPVRRAVAALHPETMRLRVVEIIKETESTSTLRLERIDGDLPPFRPGQYINLQTEVDGVRTSRAFSISSAPDAGHLDLTIKVGPNGFVAPYVTEELQPGDELTASGPSGRFRYEPLIHGTDLVFIAAGSGITPFMSMIRAFAASDEASKPRIHLIYGSRAGDVIFRDELESLASDHEWLRLTLVISGSPEGQEELTGRIDGDMIARLIEDPQDRMFFICGPRGLSRTVSGALRDLGVEEHRLLRESYGPPPDVTREENWPSDIRGDETFEVEVEGRGRITVRADEPLLNSLERNQISLPAKCRSGQCSTCRVKVSAGETFALEDAALRLSDEANGFVHACVTYPVGDLKVKI